MRKPLHPDVENGRIVAGRFGTDTKSGCNGAFILNRGERQFFVIVSDKAGWEHVSVSIKYPPDQANQTPTWEDMCWIKDLFWNEDEWVVQYHPAQSDYINLHEGVLHLWRSVEAEFPVPSMAMV